MSHTYRTLRNCLNIFGVSISVKMKYSTICWQKNWTIWCYKPQENQNNRLRHEFLTFQEEKVSELCISSARACKMASFAYGNWNSLITAKVTQYKMSTVIYTSIYLSIYLSIYRPLLGLGRFFSFFIFYTVGRTPWAGDQPVTKPLPAHTIIHASSGIRTQDTSVWTGEDSSCLRLRGHCDRHIYEYIYIYIYKWKSRMNLLIGSFMRKVLSNFPVISPLNSK
jgi:hypothetical protein